MVKINFIHTAYQTSTVHKTFNNLAFISFSLKASPHLSPSIFPFSNRPVRKGQKAPFCFAQPFADRYRY